MGYAARSMFKLKLNYSVILTSFEVLHVGFYFSVLRGIYHEILIHTLILMHTRVFEIFVSRFFEKFP